MKNTKLYKNKISFLVITLTCVLFLTTVYFNIAIAVDNTNTAPSDQIDDKKDELKKLEKKERKYRDIINLKQKEQDIINAQIKNLENENYRIEKTIEKNEDDIKKLTSETERVKREIEQKETHISLQKEILKKFIREKYQNYSKDLQPFRVLNFANKNNSIHGDNISYATGKVSEFVQTIHNEQQKLKEDKEQLEENTKKIEDTKYELEQRSDYLEGSRNYKRVLASQVNVEEDKYQEKLSKVLEEQLSIQQEISSLATSQIGTFSFADLPDKKDANFDYPIKKPFRRTQGYGKTSFSGHYKGGMHNGIDLVAQGSQTIIAPAKGKVKATGKMGRYGYGNWVAIDHGNGLTTLYGHMSSVKVSRGDKLKQGDKIGVMGNTGFSTGPHLHFSVFASSTFAVVESSSVKGIYIPTGATINPDMYL